MIIDANPNNQKLLILDARPPVNARVGLSSFLATNTKQYYLTVVNVYQQKHKVTTTTFSRSYLFD